MAVDYQKLIPKIENDLKQRLSFNRFMHSLGVAGTAATIAMFYEIDIHKAYLAGLLHDYSKEHTDKAFISIANRECMDLSEDEYKAPYLIHGKLAAIEVKRDYGIDDKDFLNSLKFHTSGRIDMTDFEKIIFISDYVEPNRVRFEGIEEIRSAIFKDLNLAVYLILKDTINYLNKHNRPVAKHTYDTLDYYKKLSGR